MITIRSRKRWELLERDVTPESTYVNRREVLAALGLGAAGAALGILPPSPALGAENVADYLKQLPPLNAKRNPKYTVDQPPTPELLSGTYNNFYEFTTGKDGVWELADKFETRPWTLEVSGLVDKPQSFDVEQLIAKMPIEERLYRLRCVEAWSAVVPWIGFPMSELIKAVSPQSGAKYVKMTTFMRPEQSVRQGQKGFFGGSEPWPYTEGLTMAEAMNELTLLTVGSYGKILPKQNGAPIRLVVPWKYGYKSIKSIDKIEFTAEQPATFWNSIAANEYGFTSNVNPNVPHPRWSQANERDIGTRQRKPTLMYNGYEAEVGSLYS